MKELNTSNSETFFKSCSLFQQVVFSGVNVKCRNSKTSQRPRAKFLTALMQRTTVLTFDVSIPLNQICVNLDTPFQLNLLVNTFFFTCNKQVLSLTLSED